MAFINESMAKEKVSMRLDSDLLERLRAASQIGQYPPTMTQIVERGIELALRELERQKRK
jgi:hypothetical protein